jgi:hypothetical protein
MEKEALTVLKAEIKAQIKEIHHIYERLDVRKKKGGKAATESIGYQSIFIVMQI